MLIPQKNYQFSTTNARFHYVIRITQQTLIVFIFLVIRNFSKLYLKGNFFRCPIDYFLEAIAAVASFSFFFCFSLISSASLKGNEGVISFENNKTRNTLLFSALQTTHLIFFLLFAQPAFLSFSLELSLSDFHLQQQIGLWDDMLHFTNLCNPFVWNFFFLDMFIVERTYVSFFMNCLYLKFPISKENVSCNTITEDFFQIINKIIFVFVEYETDMSAD